MYKDIFLGWINTRGVSAPLKNKGRFPLQRNGFNIDLLINSANALAGVESNTVAVRTISLTEESYLMLTDAQINSLGLVTVILLPLVFLVTGIVWVVYRRKHA